MVQIGKHDGLCCTCAGFRLPLLGLGTIESDAQKFANHCRTFVKLSFQYHYIHTVNNPSSPRRRITTLRVPLLSLSPGSQLRVLCVSYDISSGAAGSAASVVCTTIRHQAHQNTALRQRNCAHLRHHHASLSTAYLPACRSR